MSEDLHISGPGLVFVLLLGVAIYIGLRWLRLRVRSLSLSRPRRELFERLRPLIEAVATIVFLVLSVRIVLGDQPLYSTLVLGLILVAAVLLGWFALRDVVAGMLLKASELCLPGDWVEIGGVTGRVHGLGYRVIALDTIDGGQAFVPYSRVSRETLVRRPDTDGLFQHSFRVRFDEDGDVVERKDRLRRIALNSHWHSVVREPRVEIDEDRGFTVTVFAIASNQGHRIEKQVRLALRDSVGG